MANCTPPTVISVSGESDGQSNMLRNVANPVELDTAKASVSESYDLYSEPSHIGLERAARAEVRARIDDQLSRDYGRLARETTTDPPPANPSPVP